MKYLLSVAPIAMDSVYTDVLASAGAPVVPWFPAPVKNSFITVTDFKFCDMARVAETTLDPDALVDLLAAKYPGLPRILHETYVLHTALAAASMPDNEVVRIVITKDTATLYGVTHPELQYTLWTQQPVK